MSSAPMRSPPSTALSEADRSLLRALGQQEAQAAAGRADGDDQQAAFRSRYRERLRMAAFLGDFDPAALMPGIDESGLALLLRDCTVSTDGIVTRWRLSAGARARLLGDIVREGALEHYIIGAADFAAGTAEPPDIFSLALVALCRGNYPTRHELAAAGIRTWSAYRAALAALKGSGIPDARKADAILTDLSHAEMMEPFRFLTGWKPGTPPPDGDPGQVVGEDAFIGRRDKLARLRSFVDVLASEGYYETLSRSVRRLREPDTRTMILSGIGGVGKSTLVAKFILDHLAREPRPLHFAYLDYDRSTINAAQPATLVLEIARQLSWQAPQLREALDSLRERLRTDIGARVPNPESSSSLADDSAAAGDPVDARLPPELVPPSSLRRYLIEITDLLGEARRAGRVTGLLVLDTFEEVQSLGDEAVARVERMVDALRVANGAWRILIVGRDEVADYFEDAERDELKEFDDQASRRAFLEARGVPAALSARVAQIAGGRPLALQLAARLVREHGMDAIDLSLVQRMSGLFRKHLIEGVLYRRILDHIADKDVRDVAHPGLVLRWIDADVIASVIVPVLGLPHFDAPRIQQVMAAFRRQKDLVRVEPDGSVVHRSDVRAQMLELLAADNPVMVQRLHQAAIAYYVQRQEQACPAERFQRLRIEELYHRLCLGTDLDLVVGRWIAPARSALARALAEITSEDGQLALKILLGRLPSLDEGSRLPPLLARELAVRTVKSGLAYHAPEKALDALERSTSLLTADFIDFHMPLALDRAGHWETASREYHALSRHTSNRRHLLAAADFFERFRDSPYETGPDVHWRLHDALSRLPQANVDTELALARLERRVVPGLPSASRDLPRSAALLPVTGAATARTQWLLTLTDDIDRHGLALFDGMPVTEPMRRQLVFLVMLLENRGMRNLDPELLAFCEVLLNSRKIGVRSNEGLGVFQDARLWLVLRHLMRPATPQWYVPLAATLRRAVGGKVEVGRFFDHATLPALPEPPPRQVNTTRALADLFAQIDQLGILLPVLQDMEDYWGDRRGDAFRDLLQRYRSWRADMFPRLDPWAEHLVRPG